MTHWPFLQPNPDGHCAAVSTMPSQLLSRPSQTSGVGSEQPSQTKPMVPRQMRRPALQVPPFASTCAWVSPGHRHTWPVWGKLPLSMTPSQLSSIPLQVSGCGIPVALQTRWPMLQTNVPDWQVPRPLPHLSPTPGSVPSSIWPLQLSSRPLQTSVCGVTVGASQNVPVLSARQARMPPRRQMPTPLLKHDAPTMKPSSMSPLQLLSRPSQSSVGTAQPHGWPQALGGNPSSTCPLQLSSWQLQASTAQCLAAPPFCAATLSGSVWTSGAIVKLPQAAMPLPAVHNRQAFDTPSSICPLQLSSRPLQDSAGGTVFSMMSTSACLTALVSVSVTKTAEPV